LPAPAVLPPIRAVLPLLRAQARLFEPCNLHLPHLTFPFCL
jgi:hypothetical protein